MLRERDPAWGGNRGCCGLVWEERGGLGGGEWHRDRGESRA